MTTLETPKATKQFYAYIHARPDGTPFYVGKGFGKRAHKFEQRTRYHQNIVAQCGGWDKILVSRYPVSSEEFAFEIEKGLIKTLRRMGHKLCNLTDGGEGASGAVVSEETRQKLRGRTRSVEAIEAARQSRLGVKHTPESRRKMSLAVRKNPTKYWAGKTRSEDTVAKIKRTKALHPNPRPSIECIERLKQAGVWLAEKRKKPLICVTTGQRFACAEDAAKALGLKQYSVYNAASGKRKQLAGLEFKYVI